MNPQKPEDAEGKTTDAAIVDDLPAKPEATYPKEREREEHGNRGPDEQPGFGEGA